MKNFTTLAFTISMTRNNLKSGKGITGKQIKLLWVLARQIGMDSDCLHEIIFWITGKESMKDLSVLEAKEVIDSLVQDGAKVKKKRSLPRYLPPNVVEMVTPKQVQFITYLEKKLGWQDNPERLKGFLKRIIKREGVRTKQEGIKVIQGLKNMVDHNPNPGKEVSGFE